MEYFSRQITQPNLSAYLRTQLRLLNLKETHIYTSSSIARKYAKIALRTGGKQISGEASALW